MYRIATMTTKKTTKKKTPAKSKAKKPATKKRSTSTAKKPASKVSAQSSVPEHEKAHGVALDSIQKSVPSAVLAAHATTQWQKPEVKKKKSLWRRIFGFGF